MIKINNLFHYYGDLCALNNINLEIKKGQITALVGPNGAGKSTLLKIIAVLLEPTEGEVFINNFNSMETPKLCHKLIGFLPDTFTLEQNLTVRQSLLWIGYLYKLSPKEIEIRIDNLLNKLSLMDKKQALVKELSKGMQQRIGIAQTLISNPEILILDEPASGLDPETRIDFENLIKELKEKEGKTIIVSSHILSEIERYADEMIVLKNGKIIDFQEDLEGQNAIIKILIEIPDTNFENIINFLKQKIINPLIKQKEHNEIELTYDTSNNLSAEQLLKELILADFTIKNFTKVKKTLLDQYFESVNKDTSL